MWRLCIGSLGLILTKNLLSEYFFSFWRHFGQEPRQLLTTGSWFNASKSAATLGGSLVRTYSMNISLSRLASDPPCEWQDDDLSTSMISYSLSATVDFEFVNAPTPILSAIAGSSWNAPLFPRALSLTEDSAAELDCSCWPSSSPWSKLVIILLALSKWVTTAICCSDYGKPFSVSRPDFFYPLVPWRWILDIFFSSFGSFDDSRWSRFCSLAVACLMSLATFTAGAAVEATFCCTLSSPRWLPEGLFVLPLLPRPGSFPNAGLISGLGSRIWCSSARYGFSPIYMAGPNFRAFAPATATVALLLPAFISFAPINDFNFFLISTCLASSSRYFYSYCSCSPSRPAISPRTPARGVWASIDWDADATACYTYLPCGGCALEATNGLWAWSWCCL